MGTANGGRSGGQRSGNHSAKATPRAGRGRACPAGGEVAAYGFTFGSPAGSVLVGCEIAGGSEEGNESSSVLSSSLSRSFFLFGAACPAPRSSRCKSSSCLLRVTLPPRCFAILVSPIRGKNAWLWLGFRLLRWIADGYRVTLTRAQPLFFWPLERVGSPLPG
jgi:hypothetical protein